MVFFGLDLYQKYIEGQISTSQQINVSNFLFEVYIR